MKIINHYPTGVEIIQVNEEDKKVMVENQSYSYTWRTTKYYENSYQFGEVPPDIWRKIKEEKVRIEKEKLKKLKK